LAFKPTEPGLRLKTDERFQLHKKILDYTPSLHSTKNISTNMLQCSRDESAFIQTFHLKLDDTNNKWIFHSNVTLFRKYYYKVIPQKTRPLISTKSLAGDVK
jgi:hypothetical protein